MTSTTEPETGKNWSAARAAGRTATILAAAIVAVIAVAGTFVGIQLASNPGAREPGPATGSGGPIQVVAAENFWGSLATQLGGSRANVTSIVSDPNADPHQYEASTGVAREISRASLVITNGAGFDQWASSIVAAENNPGQVVLDVQELLGLQKGVNPHFWYSPYYVNETVRAIYDDYVRIDPAGAAYYRQQYASLNSSLWTSYMHKIQAISQQFSGTKVAATEDIFVYLANATKLELVSPPAFMEALAQGNEPPSASVAQFEQLLQDKSAKVLVYNTQTVTPLTESIKALATQQGVPIVPITGTVQPPGATFQAWMQKELVMLQDALNSDASGG